MHNLKTTLILPFALLMSLTIQAQSGIEFFHGTWDEALELAKKEHKAIFMDAYAEWCGPCKRMAKDIFTMKEVGDFFNKHFINVKMDMEKGEGPKLASKYRVGAYPTLLFIDGNGDVVNSSTGALPPERLIALGKATLAKSDKSKDFEEEYANGNREADFLKSYAYALMISGKPTLKVANEYIKTQEKLDKEEVLDFIFDFTTEADCSLFDKLVEHREAILKMKGEESFKAKVQKACETTVDKAVEFASPELVTEAKKQMKAALPAFAAEFNIIADIQYAYATHDMDAVMSLTDKYVKKFAKGDAEKLYYHAQLFNQFAKDPKALAKAEKWAAEAYKLEKTVIHARTYVDLLRKNGKQEEGRKMEEEMKSLMGH